MSSIDTFTSQADPLIGQCVGRDGLLEIREPLGSGGSSDVYLAWDKGRERHAAVKLMRTRLTSDPVALARFAREGSCLGALTHPSLACIYECGEFAGRPLIASRHVTGRPLSSLLADGQPLEITTAVRIARHLAHGLAHAHANGIIHRDVTPENIMIQSQGGRPVLIDFGIARYLHSNRKLTAIGKCIGTPGYSAPEQLKAGHVDERADIFSLGVVLYEMVTGTTAFDGNDTREIDRATLNTRPFRARRLNHHIPMGLAGLIRRMTQRQPVLRIRRMGKVATRLDAIRGSLRNRRKLRSSSELLPTTLRH